MRQEGKRSCHLTLLSDRYHSEQGLLAKGIGNITPYHPSHSLHLVRWEPDEETNMCENCPREIRKKVWMRLRNHQQADKEKNASAATTLQGAFLWLYPQRDPLQGRETLECFSVIEPRAARKIKKPVIKSFAHFLLLHRKGSHQRL